MHEQDEHQQPHGEQQTQLTDMAGLLGSPEPTLVAGRYLLHRVLGVGGVAVVHEATDTRLDRRVAIKLLRDSADDETDRARFVSEARLLAGLGHPGLVRVLDAGLDRHRPFLALELVPGRTLADAMTEGLTERRVAEIGAEVAEALAHVHGAGIVHRDVKPGNVLLDTDGSARLTDFGIARLVHDAHHPTRTGMLVGTVAYLAPEQVAGEVATTAVDVYAWGLVLLEALTGQRAYPGTSVESALARLHHRPEVPATLPRPWRTLLLAMTATDPSSRPTADEVAARLRALQDEHPAPAGPTSASRSRMLVVGVGAALALLLGLGVGPALSGLGSGPAAGAASAHRGPEPPRAAATSVKPGFTGRTSPSRAVVAAAPAAPEPARATPHRSRAPKANRPGRRHPQTKQHQRPPRPPAKHHDKPKKKHGDRGRGDGKGHDKRPGR